MNMTDESDPPIWQMPPRELRLGQGEIHIWRASLTIPNTEVRELFATLQMEEQRRAQQFAFEHLRRRFVIAHGLLRDILVRYLPAKAEEIRFSYSEFGKPSVVKPQEGRTLNFNMSHSHKWVLIAIAQTRRIGVDVEKIRAELPLTEISQRIFAPEESAALRRLPEGLRPIAFFKCWTAREAYVKATGDGLARSPDTFSVSITPGGDVQRVKDDDAAGQGSVWTLHGLCVDPGYAATLVAEGRDFELHCWQWSGH